MVEYNPEIHENKGQCDICEEWFGDDELIVVDEKYCILQCIPCKDNSDDGVSYTHLSQEIYKIGEAFDEEILLEEE